jgi:hypothetical protein
MNSIDKLDSGHMNGFWQKGLSKLFFPFILTAVLISVQQLPAYGVDLTEVHVQPQTNGLIEKERLENDVNTYFELFRKDPGNPEVNHNLGCIAFERGDYDTAISAFEGVLIDQPEAAGEKLDMTGRFYNHSSSGISEQYFGDVPAQNSSEAVGMNLSKKLQAIKTSRKEHFISAKISLGLDLDDNENAEREKPDMGIRTTLGNVMTVTVDRPERTQMYTSTATVNYLYKPQNSQFSWKMTGTSYNAVYRHDDTLNVSLSDFKAGTSIGRDKLIWEIYGISNRLNLDYGRFLSTYGAGSSLILTLTPRLLLNLDGKIKRKNYFTDHSKDAENVSFSLSPVLTYGRNRLSLSLGMEYENAREDANSFARFNGKATYEASLPFSSRLIVCYLYQETGYRDIYPLFSMKRDDTVQYFTSGFTKAASLWKSSASNKEMALNMSYTYTRSDSTIDDLSTYTKNVLSAGMSMVF